MCVRVYIYIYIYIYICMYICIYIYIYIYTIGGVFLLEKLSPLLGKETFGLYIYRETMALPQLIAVVAQYFA